MNAHTVHKHTLCFKGSIYTCTSDFQSSTVLPAKSDSDFMFCLRYQGLRTDRSLVY